MLVFCNLKVSIVVVTMPLLALNVQLHHVATKTAAAEIGVMVNVIGMDKAAQQEQVRTFAKIS